MTSIVFDTLKFVKKLTTAGMTENHAQALSEALQDTHVQAKWVTQQELKEIELKIYGELNLLKWMVSFLLAGMITLIARSFF